MTCSPTTSKGSPVASIRERTRSDGTRVWQISFREDGKQCAHTVYTQSDALLWKRLIEQTGSFDGANAAHDAAQKSTYTIADAIGDHIDLLLKPGPQTIHSYRSMLDNHIRNTIGAIPVAGATEKHIADWVRGMQKKKMSAKTIRNVHGLIAAALNRCVPKLIDVSPCRDIDLPSTEEAEDHICFLTYREFMWVYDELPAAGVYKPLALFLVVTGARFGEATAVKVTDVDLEAEPQRVRLNKAWKRQGSTGYEIGAPKTRSSKRTVSFGGLLTDLLRPMVEGRPSDELLFTGTAGRVSQPVFYRVWNDAVGRTLEKHPEFAKHPRIHDLRHTSASWLLQEGYDTFKVARRLGHSSTAMVDKVYGHLMPEGMEEGARKIDKAMRPKELGPGDARLNGD